MKRYLLSRGSGRNVHDLLLFGATILVIAAPAALPVFAQQQVVLDDFSDVSAWKSAPSDGVELNLVPDGGKQGGNMRLDFDFHGYGGWASAVRPFDLNLPENFALEFDIRGKAPINQFEIKLIDDTGENVWWVPYKRYEFTDQWTHIRIKRRHIRFAWGPDSHLPLRKISAVEFTIAADSGGKGSVWIDQLMFEPLAPDLPYDLKPLVTYSSVVDDEEPGEIFETKNELAREREIVVTGWRSAADDIRPWLQVDFQKKREFGGLILDWEEDQHATDYQVLLSNDGQDWKAAYSVRGSNGGNDYLPMRESESRFVKLDVITKNSSSGVRLKQLEVAPLEFSESSNNVFQRIARDAPRGTFPKYFNGEQSFWTVVGVDGAAQEALINEQGTVELSKGSFSVEPFLEIGEKLLNWHDVECRPSLEQGYLPIPTVTWISSPVELRATALASGEQEDSVLYVRYLLKNNSDVPQQGTLYLALRPFLVNPPWQFLGTTRGVSPIRQIDFSAATATINGKKKIETIPAAHGRFAVSFDEGGVLAAITEGTGRGRNTLKDDSGFAAGVLSFPFDLTPGSQQSVTLVAPFEDGRNPVVQGDADEIFSTKLSEAISSWQEKLSGFEIRLPPSQQHIARTLQSNLAYILINRDGPGIQPGSRSYERSWIRDGSLTSAALLRLGKFEIVRDYLRWYASYQFESGKVPCCVDYRGADSVPEHDSHGQFIYAIAEYHRFTHDDQLLRELWPNVQATVDYIQQLRSERMTTEYRSEEKQAFFGLVPESISHEGYSAKPMHSYWDNFFVLRGLKDAVYVADQLKETESSRQYAAIRDEFRRDLVASLDIATKQHQIDYLPGCVELGDFDPTSTTVAVSPCDETDSIPRAKLEHTFDRYWSEFVARRDGTREWDAYTPYEWRVVGTLVRLGHKQRALEAMDYFFKHQRPSEWNHWAEVVYPDRSTGKFVGDMPHTWVGSDFVRSLLDMFAYDRDSDRSLVVGAGISEKWLSGSTGCSIRGLWTTCGKLDVEWSASSDGSRVALGGDANPPPGGIIVYSPISSPIRSAIIDGQPAKLIESNRVIVRNLPVVVDFKH